MTGSIDNLQQQIEAQIEAALDDVLSSRLARHAANPAQRPERAHVEALVSTCAYKNAVISGGLSLVPGPWGMLAIVPEIGLVLANQVRMVVDIGVALGKERYLTKELVLGILLSTAGQVAIDVLVLHGSKVLVKRSSLRVLQRLVALLGGKITQRVLKAFVSKWLPLAGAVAMAVWTKRSTEAIGRQAIAILSKEIVFVEDDAARMLPDHGGR